MEALTRTSMNVCPFVKSHSSAAMKKLAKSSNLTTRALECPVLGPAMTKRQYSTPSKPAQAAASDNFKAPKTHDAGVAASELNNFNSNEVGTDYDGVFQSTIQKKRDDNSYRFFNNINRLAKEFPKAHLAEEEDKVMVWCSNDYLGMGKNQDIYNTMVKTMQKYGVGAGGTRNIAGHNRHAIALESELASLNKKEAALVFSSCFVANDAILSLFGKQFKDLS
ncbi:unnamed protein product [Ambrosiozyma monospora]|uniref:Unnamed protein product n=1 Tax=Ambrosiozyma monospora TaxID=43982 RepID=A0ACB5SZG1_AMBMO|nr:unnamed protein product [Ambrosiozyma monospora]